MSDPYQITFLGESGVGKSTLIKQLTEGKFDRDIPPSQTAQFKQKEFEFPNGKITLDIYDTSGANKYRSLAKMFFKKAKVAILVYDVTNEKSFIELKDFWYKEVKENGPEDISFVIVANKDDCCGTKQVANETGEEFAKEIGAIFVSTSAGDGSTIEGLIKAIEQKIRDLQ